MIKIILSIIFTVLVVLCWTSSLTHAYEASAQRWDLQMIEEAPIWEYLLVKYGYAEHAKYWPERRAALQTIINEFPDSQWADDAALIVAWGKAAFEEDSTGAITALREVMKKYPIGQSVVGRCFFDMGCRFDNTWLRWCGGLVFLNPDRTIRASNPFDRSGVISSDHREALAYFNHLEKYPKLTKDIAQSAIAQILWKQGDPAGAIAELEQVIARHPDLVAVNKADREAASKPDGYIIGHESVGSHPLWRPEYSVYLSLMGFYQRQGQNDEAVTTGLKLASICSNDGWYWKVNRRVGDVCAKNGRWIEAEKQYQLALEGCRRFVGQRISRKKIREDMGFATKPTAFVSWEHNVLEVEGWKRTITKLENLLNEKILRPDSKHNVVADTTFAEQSTISRDEPSTGVQTEPPEKRPLTAEEEAELMQILEKLGGTEISTHERQKSCVRLMNLGDKRAVPVLLTQLDPKYHTIVRQQALKALRKIGDPQAIPAIIKVLREPLAEKQMERESQAIIRRHCLKTLEAIQGEEALPILRKFANNQLEQQDVREVAAGAISRLESND